MLSVRMFDSIQRFFDTAFYQKPQEYTVVFGAKITNTSSAAVNLQLTMPLPRDTNYQESASPPSFSHPSIVKTEVKFRNHYAVWAVDLPSKKSDVRRMTMTVKVTPIKYRNRETASLESYRTMSVTPTWLSSDLYIQAHHPEIQRLAAEFRAHETDVYRLIQNVNRYVIKTLRYGKPIPGLYTTEDALLRDQVDCGGYVTFFAALLRAIGIPARIALGFWAGYSTPSEHMHAWLEAQLPDGSWLPIDPSTEALRDARRTQKYAALGFFGSDHILFSYGAGITLEASPDQRKIDILQNPVIFPEEVRSKIKLQKIFSATRK
jgi:transglutaminase-like putative cysteine protease